MKVSDVMTSNIESLTLGSSIKDAATKMVSLNVGSMPVCDTSNNPVGIITDRDIVIRNVSKGLDGNSSVDSAMTNRLITVSPDTDIHEAARIMSKNQIRRLPVVKNNKLVGMLSIGDLAVRNIYENEAGSALSQISQPSRPSM